MDDKNNMFFLEVLGNIDDRFIVEVENNWSSHKRYILWKKIALAAIATIFIGVTGTLQGMLTFVYGKIQTQGTMLLILSFVIGCLIC